MNIKRNIIFALESRKKNDVPIAENVPIRMRVVFASKHLERGDYIVTKQKRKQSSNNSGK